MTFSHTQVMLQMSHELTHLGAYESMDVRVSECGSDYEFKKNPGYLEILHLNLTFPFPKL